MAFIRTVPEHDASPEVGAMYDHDRASLGYVANYTKAFSLRPAAMHAWVGLKDAIKGAMDPRRYELATLAAALALRSSYCSLAHGQALRAFYRDEEIERIARDYRGAGLSDAEVALMRFAQRVTLQPHEIAQEDVDELRAHGFADAEVLDIALAAAARNFFSRVLDATGAPPDPAFAALPEPLREALAVGR